MDIKTYIYSLEKNGIPIYIGKTTNPTRRKKQHIRKMDFDKMIHFLERQQYEEFCVLYQ